MRRQEINIAISTHLSWRLKALAAVRRQLFCEVAAFDVAPVACCETVAGLAQVRHVGEKMLPYVTTTCESVLIGSTNFCCFDRYHLQSVSSSVWSARTGAALFVVGCVRAMALLTVFFLGFLV